MGAGGGINSPGNNAGAASTSTTARHVSKASSHSSAKAAAESVHSERVIQTTVSQPQRKDRGPAKGESEGSGLLSPSSDFRNAALTFSKSASLLSRSFLSQSSVTNLLSDEDWLVAIDLQFT